MSELHQSGRPRVRRDQPTIRTLEQALAAARDAATKSLTDAGFFNCQVVVNAVVTSIDPDDDVTTWAVGSLLPQTPDSMLAASLRTSAEEASR